MPPKVPGTTETPKGNSSLNAIPDSAVARFGLLMRKLSVVWCPTPMVAGEKALLICGASTPGVGGGGVTG